MATQTKPYKETSKTTKTDASFRSFKKVTIALNDLITFPAKLITATSEEKSPFRLAVVKDGKASSVSQFYTADNKEYFTIGQLGKAVQDGDKLIPVTPAELESLKTGTAAQKGFIKFDEFVPLASVDPTFFDNSYVLVPNTDEQSKGGNPQAPNLYHLLLKTLIASGRVGTAKMYDRDREYNIIIRPNFQGTKLMLHTIYTSNEVREFDVPQPTCEINTDLMAAGLAMIQAKFADFNPNGIVSETDGKISALAARKIAESRGEVVVPGTETPAVAATPANDGNALLAALTASLHAQGVKVVKEAAQVTETKVTV